MKPVLVSIDQSGEYAIEQPSTYIGRTEWKVDICLPDPAVAEVHCELIREENSLKVVDLGHGSVFVNGNEVEECNLGDGDELTIATYRFRLGFDSKDDDALVETTFSEASSETNEAEDDSEFWMLRMGELELGPMAWFELEEMISAGTVQLDDPVRLPADESWQTVGDVLSRRSDWLTDEPNADPDDGRSASATPIRSRLKTTPKPARNVVAPHTTSEPHADNEGITIDPDQQFIIIQNGREVGPLPMAAIQESATAGTLLRDTPIRSESSAEWSTAAERNIEFPEPDTVSLPDSADPDPLQPRNEKPVSPGALLLWYLLAPVFAISSLIQSLLTLRMAPRKVAVVIAACLLVTWAGWSFVKSWSQTALSGTITLDGEPLPDVLIHATGPKTGDLAIGLSNGSGRFRLVTPDGELKPGDYQITVTDRFERSDSIDSESKVPARYQSLATSDLWLIVAPDTTSGVLQLSTAHRLTAPGGLRRVNADRMRAD